MIANLVQAAERLPLPDAVTRHGIRLLVGRTDRRLAGGGDDAGFAADMAAFPVAEHADAANAQHYEIPAAFFAEILGPRRKYSCCLYAGPDASLAEAETLALEQTCAHADLHDGQDVLELGCGWGSLSLWMAEMYPDSRIVAVSNSQSQRTYIEAQAAARKLANLEVVTADMNVFAPHRHFDRIVSVEMFEHMANWSALLARARDWLRPDGRLFLHVFTHVDAPYRFDRGDKGDWIAQHFFTGGVMPSHGLIRHFGHLFALEQAWQWNGTHYARTARDWLDRFDARLERIRPILRDVYARDARLWERRWRLFFLATEGLFGFQGGSRWGVSHYRLSPTHATPAERPASAAL